MKIVILESETVNPGDLSWEKLEALGDLTVYPELTPKKYLLASAMRKPFTSASWP